MGEGEPADGDAHEGLPLTEPGIADPIVEPTGEPDALETPPLRPTDPRRPRRKLVPVAALTLLVIAVAAGFVIIRGADRHEEGQGELAMLGNGSSTISDYASVTADQAVTFGLPLCHLRGDTPILDAVTATSVVGNGFRVVGSGVRTFVPTASDQPLFSVDGWPPNPSVVPDAIAPVAGYSVTSACTNGLMNGSPYTELLVAMQRTSPAGGGWMGFEIAYVVGGRHRVLHSPWQYGFCGTALPCDPGPTESPAP